MGINFSLGSFLHFWFLACNSKRFFYLSKTYKRSWYETKKHTLVHDMVKTLIFQNVTFFVDLTHNAL